MSEARQKWRGRRRPVVKIDRDGKIVARYGDAMEAANANFMTLGSVKYRCYGRVKKEFALIGYSFRYEDLLREG